MAKKLRIAVIGAGGNVFFFINNKHDSSVRYIYFFVKIFFLFTTNYFVHKIYIE